MRYKMAIGALAALSLTVTLLACGRPTATSTRALAAPPATAAPAKAAQDAAPDAPDFPANLKWFNTDRPLSLKDLHGKVVLLDFWTFG